MNAHDDPFGENLATLCSFYPSIADVCRRLSFNRQQFNKYLSGQVRPTRHNMRVICDFFGVEESEMYMDSGRFSEIISLRKRPVAEQDLQGPLAHVEALFQSSLKLDRYVGYYFRYYYSFSDPGRLVKSFAKISEKKGRYYWSNLELIKRTADSRAPITAKYKGVLFFLADRIFVIEFHSLLHNSITEMILYPSYQTRISYLTGIQTGAPATRGRRPAASLVLLEYLGKDVDIRKAIRSTGLFAEDSSAIDPKIRELVRNRITKGCYVLEASEA